MAKQATIFVFHNNKTYKLTEAEYLVAYHVRKWFAEDDRVTLQIGKYIIDADAEVVYWCICDAMARKIDRNGQLST